MRCLRQVANQVNLTKLANFRHMDKERAGTQPVEGGFARLQVLAASAGMGAAKARHALVSFQRLASLSRHNAVYLAPAGAPRCHAGRCLS